MFIFWLIYFIKWSPVNEPSLPTYGEIKLHKIIEKLHEIFWIIFYDLLVCWNIHSVVNFAWISHGKFILFINAKFLTIIKGRSVHRNWFLLMNILCIIWDSLQTQFPNSYVHVGWFNENLDDIFTFISFVAYLAKYP